ncbi:hypothetical protein LPY66_05615 [Dehalobacter sp. DCM]|uniref:hypothetical protein n=1 Tax=Dehalobacter sp. DCM TaxID=2907827 RepID=UPI0030812997|nr:hypothetical protein LPY66_05615 [Dehalobacter sp. DCM]
MERHGIEWEQLGTHEEHLSVVDYKKVQRVKEVAALEETISGKQEELDNFLSRLVDIQDQLQTAESKERFIAQNAGHYDNDPEYQLQEPRPLMSAKSYREKVAEPLVQKLKVVIRSILSQFFEKTRALMIELDRANSQIGSLYKRLEKSEAKGERLQGVEKDYNRLRRFLGGDRTDEIISDVKVQEMADKAKSERKGEVFSFYWKAKCLLTRS